MSFLTGSAPQATFNTQPTINPQQTSLLDMLTGILSTGNIQPSSGIFAAPVTGAQDQLLSQLQGQASTPNISGLPAAQTAVTGALQALPAAQSFQAPQIDPTAAFQTGVVQPLTTNFNQNVLPGIEGQYGGTAGGAFGTQALQARQTAGTNLDQTLAQAGSQYTLGAQEANQSADIAAQNSRLAALGLTPSLAGTSATLPGATTSANVSPLLQILSALGLPQQTAQTQITGSYGNSQQTLADLIASFSPSTQSTIGVGTGGTTGIAQSLLGGLAGNSGLGSGIGSFLAGLL